jgi:site-specific DNA-methyltransferase (adenine-specific)
MTGAIHLGDNLAILREHVADASIDLVYLDPPFNSERTFTARVGKERGAAKKEVHGFDDAWPWDASSDEALATLDRSHPKLARVVRALRDLYGESGLAAYSAMMAPRLLELSRVLRPTGSLYVHCDPTASHALRLLLDATLGPDCFRNEIIWRYRRWPAKSRRFQRMHDVLLFYTRAPGIHHTFHALYGYEDIAASTRKTFGTKKQNADFSSGHRKPGTLDEETIGPPLSDVWEVGVLAPIAKERLGWPTQKPEALLERVVRASSNQGDVVLDPFCGSGTTLAVAAKLGRRWIGIDASPVAVELAEKRLAPMRNTLFERG